MNIAQVAAIREMFPNEELYYVKLSDDDYIVRTITPNEYATIRQLATNKYDIEDIVTQTSIVYPSRFIVNYSDAGVATRLAKIVLDVSLLADNSSKTIKYRFLEYYNGIVGDEGAYEQMLIVIKMAFPEFTFEEIEEWTQDRQIKNYARAVYGLQLRGINIPLVISEDEEEIIDNRDIKEKELEILAAGGDPVAELYNEYKTEGEIIESPFLGSRYWDDEVVINAIQRQLWR